MADVATESKPVETPVETKIETPAEPKAETPAEPKVEASAEPKAEASGEPKAEAQSAQAAEEKTKQSRSEKKTRKAIQKMGMKPFPGIVRVTMKKSKNILFVIAKPDVYRSPGSDTYIIFGEAKIEDLSNTSLAKQAQQVVANENAPAAEAQPAAAPAAAAAAATAAAPAEAQPAAAAAADEEVDATGLEPNDIELVIAQANTTRAKAIRALRKTNGDIVNAIMELTM